MSELGAIAGEVIAQRYHLMEFLGQGAMASVWAAQDCVDQRQVALKILKPEWFSDAKTVKRFLQEAKAARKLESPFVVRMFDHGYVDGICYIAMEHLVGESLEDRLQRAGALSRGQTMTWIEHVGRAVALAHQAGIVHRDLKPSNIFLVPKGEHTVAKVLDFGLVKILNPEGKTFEELRTTTGMALGTPFYMSPEQLTSTEPVDERADLWSMAIVVYECLCGRLPFEEDSMGELVLSLCTRPHPVPSAHGDVPRRFDAWFARAAALDPKRRYQSVTRFLEALAHALGVPTEPLAEKTRSAVGSDEISAAKGRRSSTRRGWTGLVAALVVIAVAAAWYFFLRAS